MLVNGQFMAQLVNLSGNTLLNLKFSLNEQETGLQWIDGKKIYCKGYQGTLPQSQTAIDKIENIDNLLFCLGMAGSINGWYINVNQYFTAGYRWTCQKYGNQLLLGVEDYSKSKPYQLIVLYTKK
ncbi:hypothetical protein DWZ53_08840 [Coprobacillus sp. AF33-1AC]|nr:hypothetical protein DWZ53_08840 [Coprobacillus sp. AF33-1AC]